MGEEVFPMTEEGLEAIKQELIKLETLGREDAKKRIKKARGFCDFQEDSEYEMALKELARIEKRIAKLNYEIQHVQIIEKADTSYVTLGSTATFKEIVSGELETYMIVGTEEADPFVGKISNESKVAQSLLGAKVGEVVTIKAPEGNREVVIKHIT